MYEFLVDKTAERLAPALGLEKGSVAYATLRYGCYVVYLNGLKSLLLVAAALLLGVLRYVLVFAAAYCSLRLYSFGIHLEHPLTCTLLGLVYYLGGAWLSVFHTPALWVQMLLLAVSFAMFCRYTPAASKHRPIPVRQRGAFRKRSIAIFCVVIIVAILLTPWPAYSNQVVMAAVCQTVNLLPLTYKLMGKEVKP